MFKRIFNRVFFRKEVITDDRFCYEIYVKERYIKDSMFKAKGWRIYSDAGRDLGYSKAYLSLLDRQLVPASAEVITRFACALNNINGNWNAPFEFKKIKQKRSFQRFNMAKHDGRIPYKKYSIAAAYRKDESRSKTYEVEVEK